MITRRLLPALLTLTALAVAAEPAVAARPVLDGEGVTVSRHGSRVVFHFAATAQGAAAHRRFAGRRAEVECDATPRLDEVVSASTELTARVRVARRRAPVSAELHTPAALDWCTLTVRAADGGELSAILGITAAGRTYLDRVFTAAPLLVVGGLQEGTDRSAATLVAKSKGYVVALPGPDATPPYGHLGYWTDGNREVRVAVAKDGYRLFLETEGDVVRSNALGYFTSLD